jgi:hypothetical protein
VKLRQGGTANSHARGAESTPRAGHEIARIWAVPCGGIYLG